MKKTVLTLLMGAFCLSTFALPQQDTTKRKQDTTKKERKTRPGKTDTARRDTTKMPPAATKATPPRK
ncbi:hypothetical protein [Pedobacter sp. SYP-B3415]|uniref:hypothetical protein n=1 Tax=Pedobacter sp. SYP-B3415 TaxID=2496641 RepID=UPI00101CA5BC|nr:hypothetical protein [Pedobacter sp. SYP-B3415]